MSEKTISIAIQKSGRLSEESLQLLKNCGISLKSGMGQLKTKASNFPLEILFLRDDDIPGYIEDGVATIGIVGQNVLEESSRNVKVVKELGFAKCRLCIAVPRGEKYHGPEWLQSKNIATSYPKLTENWLKSVGVNAQIHEISGSVEIAPSIGLAEAVCDIVSSGSTLLMNGLTEVETIFRSEAVLISGTNVDPEAQELIDKLTFRINSVLQAANNKYILLNAPDESLEQIINYLPGMKAPTILPLAKEGWSSLHSVINENEFWDKIESLKALGAEGILVCPIEKMVI